MLSCSWIGKLVVAGALGISLALPAAATAATIRPLHDRVLIARDDDRTKGGIIIPETAKEKAQRGTVIAVGPGRVDGGTRVPVDVQPGDQVLFGSYAGTEIRVEGVDLLIMRESDIYAILDD